MTRLTDWFSTATARLAGLYLLLFVASVGLLAMLFMFQVRSVMQQEARSQVRTELGLLLFEYAEDGVEELLEEIEERIEKTRGRDRLLYMVRNPAGIVIFDDSDSAFLQPGWVEVGGEEPRLYLFEEFGSGYVLGVGKNMSALISARETLLNTVVWSGLGVLVFGALGGLWLSRRTLAQLRAINDTAVAIGKGDLSHRIPLRGTADEVDALSGTLNDMFDRIESLVASVQRVSSGIAHDLRTPLARLRSRLEQLQRSTDTITPADISETISNVDDILLTFAAILRLSELEAGTLKAEFEPVDMSALVQQVAEAYQPSFEDAGNTLRVEASEAVQVFGIRRLLQQMLANLLENTLQHAGAGAEVKVGIQALESRALLVVSDNGPGLPDAEHDTVTEPFKKLGDSGGSGLGLAMVLAIAQLHEGGLALTDNAPGLQCRVDLPLRH